MCRRAERGSCVLTAVRFAVKSAPAPAMTSSLLASAGEETQEAKRLQLETQLHSSMFPIDQLQLKLSHKIQWQKDLQKGKVGKSSESLKKSQKVSLKSHKVVQNVILS